MRLIYLSTARIPDDWAHVTQIMKMCEAFSTGGLDVELVVPKRAQTRSEDPYASAGVKQNFKITHLPALDLMRYRVPYSFNLLAYSFFIGAQRYLANEDPTNTIIYVRGDIILPVASLFASTFRVYWETHAKPGTMGAYARVLPKLAGVVTVTQYYRNELIKEYGVPESKIICTPDAVTLEDFQHPESREAARTRLGIPLDAKTVFYIGLLDAWKGVDTLFAAAQMLAPEIMTVVIGGFGDEVERQKEHSSVRFLGFRPYTELPDNQQAADVLVLPNSGSADVSVKYTSPLKLFAYMASGKPIVASDLPALREILDERNSFLVPADDPKALAEMILYVFANPAEVLKRAAHAREDVKAFTWQKRAQSILALITRTKRVL